MNPNNPLLLSHSAERKEKICLNCNASLIGLYCHNCGQENKEPKESIWHFTTHFFNDITHFDGKFFTTLKDLIFRPGFLSKEFMLGRRASYLDPVRMYLFTSFIFFLIFFSTNIKPDIDVEGGRKIYNGETEQAILSLPKPVFDSLTAAYNNGVPMTPEEFKEYGIKLNKKVPFGDLNKEFPTVKVFDSSMAAGSKKYSWIKKKLVRKQIELNQKYLGKDKEFAGAILEIFQHKFPQVLFLSLPFLALLLKLLYIRHKKFYYVTHAVFSIQLYIFIFIVMLVQIGLVSLGNWWHTSVTNYFIYALTLATFFYAYKAMRNFYGQGRGKTFFKYILFLIGYFFIIVTLITLSVLLSVWQA